MQWTAWKVKLKEASSNDIRIYHSKYYSMYLNVVDILQLRAKFQNCDGVVIEIYLDHKF